MRKINSSIKRAILALSFCSMLLIPSTGCKTATAKLPTGAINSFDATAFDTLFTAQAAINSLKASPMITNPQFKTALDDVIKSYNVAVTTYSTWHSAGATGDTTSLNQDLLTITAGISALEQQLSPAAQQLPSPVKVTGK